jgi:ribose transport system substrate-binding protein
MKVSILSMLSGQFDPYWKEFERGVAAARKNIDVEVELLTPDSGGKTEREITSWQLRMANEIARDKDVKAAGVAILNFSRAAEAISAIHLAGIPAVTFDTDAPDSQRAFFIGTNNRVAGSTCAYVMTKLLTFKGKLIIFTPCNYVQSCMERIGGFREVMQRYTGIEIVSEAVGDENEKAMLEKAKEIIETKDLAGLFCTSGTGASISAELIAKKGLSDKIKIVSIDVNDAIIQHINNGVISMSVAQRPYSMGFLLMDYLNQVAHNGIDNVLRGVPKSRIVDTGIHQVTKSSIPNYLDMLKKSEDC